MYDRLRLEAYLYGDRIAQLVERPTEKQGATLSRVQVPGVARDFCPSQLPEQTLVRCPYSPRVQWQASTAVYTLKIPNTGSHTISKARRPKFPVKHTEVLPTKVCLTPVSGAYKPFMFVSCWLLSVALRPQKL